jgi:F0F1-type ATP synthase membrane subunit b/b'
MTAIDGQVNMDDLLTVAPNGVVRMKSQGAVQALTVPPTAAQSFPMLDYMDQVLQKRSGVTQTSQGLDANILQNTTATAIAAMQQAGSGRLEMIARIFADTGVKDLFAGIFHLLCKYQDKERVLRLRGKYVSVDPRNWKTNYDVSINVGLGTGNKDQQMAMAAMVLQKQEQILGTQGFANPLVTVGQYRNTLGRFIEAAGYKDSNEFFKEISPELDAAISQPPPPQQAPVDPAVQAYMAQTQAQIQGEQAKMAAKMEADKIKAAADIQLQRDKAAAEIQLQREKAAAELQLQRDKAAGDLQLKQAEHNVDVQLKAMENANTMMQKGIM